ncbi:AzlD domain-containing protein [Furfurilactobacillus rossiae]|uniref:Branched-chain amino acid ABC transporter n=1 Tax=Furfurilactobacillus rossiae DSM 15814 TaxID=1114972 RepID=A0A0R1RE58_9LACO|nr:AzlD domain-containing protein [Furfurilactobacillus rossiae]KRL55062.1 hypothetical protein FD35_GL002517 [Furfurilactobacillus rossiae DSM 15814]QFR67723.1 AzlD domain-containing protein [Furfurilactobacillus rossiae]QLE60690.1 hypothetical protein LROSRS0_0642 [Furfurilactobacillus rossiae]
MLSTSYVLLTIVGCGIVTLLSRTLPFVLLKNHSLPPLVVELLSFVPITIMTALWVTNLFTQHLGHLPSVNYENLFASIPTVITAAITKILLWIVLVGVVSLAILRAVM